MTRPTIDEQHYDLQRIEHINKVLEAHQKLLLETFSTGEDLFSEYLPKIKNFVFDYKRIQDDFSKTTSELLKSASEIRGMTSNARAILDFVQSVRELERVLTPELIAKLRLILKETA